MDLRVFRQGDESGRGGAAGCDGAGGNEVCAPELDQDDAASEGWVWVYAYEGRFVSFTRFYTWLTRFFLSSSWW